MKNQENVIEKIDRYLNGEMSASEKAAFEEQVHQDKELREEVAMQHDIKIGIGKFEEANLNVKLQEKETMLRQSNQKNSRGKSGKIFLWTALAAGFSLMLIAFIWLFITDSPQALYAEYYQPYPNVVSPIDRAQPSAVEENPFQLYETGRYADAIALFEKEVKEAPSLPVHFYQGLSYLATRQTGLAIEQLEMVSETNHALASPAQWYLGLSYLRDGNQEKAKEVFHHLASGNSDYQEKARSVLEEM